MFPHPNIPPRNSARGQRTIIGLAFCLGISGCSVGPDYLEPISNLMNFHGAGAVASRADKAPAPPMDRWWNGFNDPELSRIVGRALDQNLDIAAALARVEQARASVNEAGAQLLPTFNFSSDVAKQRQSLESPIGAVASHLPGYNRTQSQYDVGAAASWEIDLFGGLSRGEEAATDEAEAAQAAHLGTRISVAADAADAYLRIRGDQARIAVATHQVETDAQLLDLVQRRFASGIATDREVAQAEALLYAARAFLHPLRIDLEGQLNRLDVLMGVQPGTYAAELTAPGKIPAAPAIADETPADLLRRRPDIIAAERHLAASNARIGQAISDYYPKLSLSDLLGFESLDASHLIRATTFQPQGILGLRWRLFDFGKIDAEVALAKGANAEALARYRLSVLHAAEDVENAFTALVQLEAHTQELEREVTALSRALDRSQEAYQSGVIALTDVLDADRQLLSAQDEQVRTQVDTARAAVSTFRALGGGWSTEKVASSEVQNAQND